MNNNDMNDDDHQHDDQQQQQNGRQWTISVAIPSSIVDNAQTNELRSYLIGQIARSLVIFKIDEIIVYDEYCIPGTPEEVILDKRKQTMVQTIRILEYLDCPQYLRRQLFPIQKYLQYAGLLNPLEAPHHLCINDQCAYREGIVMETQKNNKNAGHDSGSLVNIGLKQYCFVSKKLQPNIRVTVKLDTESKPFNNQRKRKHNSNNQLFGEIVSPNEPREKLGLYWGYRIRMANSLSEVFQNCPFNTTDGQYDLKIGTSDKGVDINKCLKQIPFKRSKHTLIVFGGVQGIEAAHETDESLNHIGDTGDLFDFYVNTCPNQGSDTIRTEEAILITLAAMQKRLYKARNFE